METKKPREKTCEIVIDWGKGSSRVLWKSGRTKGTKKRPSSPERKARPHLTAAAEESELEVGYQKDRVGRWIQSSPAGNNGGEGVDPKKTSVSAWNGVAAERRGRPRAGRNNLNVEDKNVVDRSKLKYRKERVKVECPCQK